MFFNSNKKICKVFQVEVSRYSEALVTAACEFGKKATNIDYQMTYHSSVLTEYVTWNKKYNIAICGVKRDVRLFERFVKDFIN